MKFHDLNIRGQYFGNDLKLVKEASRFGWDYVNLNYYPEYFKRALDYKSDLIDKINDFENPIEINMGLNIVKAKNPNEVRKLVNKYRNKTSYLSVLGGDLKINRGVCENIKIDVLSRPYYKRHDSGMNHVLAKEAVKNNVAIELCFRDILNQHLKYRANVIASFKEILKFHRKFKFPIILTTDSKSLYDMRSTRDIVAVFKCIGFTNEEIYNGFCKYPQEIIDFNKDRKNMVIKGVKVIEGATDFTDVYKNDEDSKDFEDMFCDNLEESDSMDLSDIDDGGLEELNNLDDIDFEDLKGDFDE